MSETVEVKDPRLEFIQAFIKMQPTLSVIEKDAINPHFKSKYAQLTGYIAELKKVLPEYGFSFWQNITGDGDTVSVETLLMHEAGYTQSSGVLTLKPDKSTPQGAGAAISYAKRYSLSCVGLVSGDEDTDGHSEGSQEAPKGQTPEPAKAGADNRSDAQMGMLRALLSKLGITERDDILDELSTILKLEVPLASSKDLSKKQASAIIKELEARVKMMETSAPPEESTGPEVF